MKRLRPFIVLITLLVALQVRLAFAQDTAPKRVTVMAYNVLNLFDVFDDPYTLDEETRVKPRAEIEKVAALIRKINPDVITLEEVENEGVMRAVVRELLGDMGYDYITASHSNSDRGIRLGVISRLPIISETSHRFTDLTLEGDTRHWRFARDLMRVELRVSDTQTLDLYVVHLKSKHDDTGDPQSASWRLAEATAARKIIAARQRAMPSHWTLMVGDFNDTPASAPISALLKPTDEATTLVDLHAALPAQERITYLRKPYRSTIDFMLAGPSLAKRLAPDSARVISDESLLGGSDHAPVIATFDVGE